MRSKRYLTLISFLMVNQLNLLYTPLMIPRVYCYINSFQRASRVGRPSHGGENITAVWTTHHAERCSDGVVSPHVCDPMLVPHRWVVHDWYNPWSQPWTPAVARPHMRDGWGMLLMAVWCPCRRPSMCHPVHRELMRKELLDVTTIVPATPCHQRNYVQPYSRCIGNCIFRIPELTGV